MNIENFMGQSEGTQIRDLFKSVGIELPEFPAPGYEPPGVYRDQQVVDAFLSYDKAHPGCVDMSLISSHMTGTQIRDAFRCILKKGVTPVHVLPDVLFDELADWAVMGSGTIAKHGDYLWIGGNLGQTDGVTSVKTYHFDPAKWYKITVGMEINPRQIGRDHEGGQFTVEMKGHQFNEIPATLGWGITGGLGGSGFATQTLVIAPGTAELDAHFKIFAMDEPNREIQLSLFKIEAFDSDPRKP